MINDFFSYKTRLYIFENRIQCIIQDKLHVLKKNYDNQNSLFYLYSSSLHKASVMKNMNLISSCCQYVLFIAGFFLFQSMTFQSLACVQSTYCCYQKDYILFFNLSIFYMYTPSYLVTFRSVKLKGSMIIVLF